MVYISDFVKKVLITLLHGYRFAISLALGPCCRFQPTCSQYAVEAIEHYGSLKGSYKALKRVLRCHPWQKGGIDPV